MPSYVATSLFPIKEALNSSSSLQDINNDIEIQHPSHASNLGNDNYEEDKLILLIHNYKNSESDYRVELKLLKSIITSFNPVYNDYFDDSLNDITDEMISIRQEKNDSFMKIVENLILSHDELNNILSITSLDTLLIKLSNWGINIVQWYMNYIDFYKLNIYESKIEIKTKRRPMIRVKYLNNFFKNLKNIIIHLQEREHSANVLSNLEIIHFKLSKCLEKARIADESEKNKWDNHIILSNCKDIITFKNVGAQLKNSDLQSQVFNCKFQYYNNTKNIKLNFDNIILNFLKNDNQFVIFKKDNFGKVLLFCPLKHSDFYFVNQINDKNGLSLLFSNSMDSNNIQLTFTLTGRQSELKSKLLEFFPERSKFSFKHNKASFGLGISIESKQENTDKKIIGNYQNNSTPSFGLQISIPKQPLQSISESDLNIKNNNSNNIITNTNTNKSKHIYKQEIEKNLKNIDEKEKEKPTQISNKRSSNIPLYKLQYQNSMTNITNDSFNFEHSINDDKSNNLIFDENKQKEISMKFIHSVANNISSDDESFTEDESYDVIGKINDNEPITLSIEKIEPETIPKIISQVDKPAVKKQFSFDKYKNSLSSSQLNLQLPDKSQIKQKQKKKTSSIFGAFTNLLSKNSIKPQKIENNLADNSKQVSPTESLNSISSVIIDKSKEMEIITLNPDCKSINLKNAKISLWAKNNWTKSKDMKLVIHQLYDTYYLGCYDKQSIVFLLKLDNETDCMFNTIDIHLKTLSYCNNRLTILIRPINKDDMKLIGNAIICPDTIKNVINNSDSYESKLSNMTNKSNKSNNSSVESFEEINKNEKQDILNSDEYKEEEYISKNWTGVGDLHLIDKKNSNQLKDLNRCVFNVDKKRDYICIDLTGFEFGNIVLKVAQNEIKNYNTEKLQVLIKSEESYILTFDSLDELELFEECVS